MATNALTGKGTVVEMSTPAAPGTWVPIDECFRFGAPTDSFDQIDVTHYGSSRREFIAGLGDSGEAEIEMNYIPGSGTDTFLLASKALSRNVRVTFPNAVTVTFVALVRSYEPTDPVDDKLVAKVTLKVSGDVTQLAAAAPVNSLGPSIVGQAKTGVVLTAVEGIWSGGPSSYGYQWRRAATQGGLLSNITGATNKTYTPVVGDQTFFIAVNVTAINSAGQAASISAVTAAVIP
jgi:hypothetical protein